MPPVKKPKTKPTPKMDKTVSEETTPVVSGQLEKKIKSIKKRQKPQRGVVFIKHLPHGFFEEQLRNYFEQFGAVTRLRLARSKSTGGTKGYAFIEFEYPEVAEVAADTMDNYLMFNKVVQASYIPPEKQIYNFFKTSVRKVKNKAGKAIYVSTKTAVANRNLKKFNNWSDEAYQKRTAIKQKRIKKLNEKYAHLGIDFNAIITGSKKVSETNGKTDATTETNKAVKRKTKSTEQTTNKKSKKSPKLEDLLGSTINEDSDDEDFVLEENSTDEGEEKDSNDENVETKQKRKKSVTLEDLLGETLNEDSEDSEYELNSDDDDDNENDEVEDEDDVESEDNDSKAKPNKSIKSKKAKDTTTKDKKTKKSKVDRFEELIQHKKHTGGVQKASKVISKKPKIGKAKNSMQAALTKQLAKPLPTFKKAKQGKKQKK